MSDIEVKHSIETLRDEINTPEFKFAIFEKLGYKIHHPEVDRFHRSNCKVKVARAPSRSGKSYSSAHDLLPTCLVPNTRTWIVGESYHLAEKEFRVVEQQLVLNRDKLGLPKPIKHLSNPGSGQLFIKWPWGAILEGKSADNPSSLLGEAVHHVLYSEAAQLKREIRERYVMQRLGTTRGKEIVPTTPMQSAEWVKELDDMGASGNYNWVESFHWPVTANPEFQIEELNAAVETYGIDHPMIREQYFGEWVYYAGRVYPGFQSETHVIEPFEIPRSWARYRGIDFGHRDPFVTLWVAVNPNGGELYLYREYYETEGVSTPEHVEYIRERSRDEQYKLTVGDPTSRQLIEDLNHAGLSVVSGNNDRAAGRARLSEYLAMTEDGNPPFNHVPDASDRKRWPRLYVFNTCKETIREFMHYRWREGRAVEGEKERTEGDDHTMDTLRYIVMERPSPSKSKKREKPYTFKWELKRRRRPKYQKSFIGVK